jgi:hypothetical protein
MKTKYLAEAERKIVLVRAVKYEDETRSPPT